MTDTSRQLHFTHSLEYFYQRLDALLRDARQNQAQFSPDLLDEIAYTAGELMLVLMNHEGCEQDKEPVKEVLSHAQRLRERLRSHQLQNDQIAESCDIFREEIALLIHQSKKAA